MRQQEDVRKLTIAGRDLRLAGENVETGGEILGKGTHTLEGYTLEDKGYFGPGELPTFDPEIFDMPNGKVEDVLFEDLKLKLLTNQVTEGPEGDVALRDFAHKVHDYVKSHEIN